MADMQLCGGSPLYRDYIEQEQKKTEKKLRHEPGTLSFKSESLSEQDRAGLISWLESGPHSCLIFGVKCFLVHPMWLIS